MPRVTTVSCCAPKAERCSRRGARRWSGGWSASDERVLLFNCANGNKYPLADRSKRLKLAEARPESL